MEEDIIQQKRHDCQDMLVSGVFMPAVYIAKETRIQKILTMNDPAHIYQPIVLDATTCKAYMLKNSDQASTSIVEK